MSAFQVTATGHVISGFDPSDVLTALGKHYPRLSKSQLKRFLNGSPTVVASVGSESAAEVIVSKLRMLGVDCYVAQPGAPSGIEHSALTSDHLPKQQAKTDSVDAEPLSLPRPASRNTGRWIGLVIGSVLTAGVIGFTHFFSGPSEHRQSGPGDGIRQDVGLDTEALLESVRNELLDPQSAQFRSIGTDVMHTGICGEVNGKNSFGGYVGFRPFFATPDRVDIYAPVLNIVDANGNDVDLKVWASRAIKAGFFDCPCRVAPKLCQKRQ